MLCRNIVPFDSEIKGEEPDGEFHFCCLGVACDLFLDAYWNKDKSDGSKDKRWEIRGKKTMPPPGLKNAINAALPGLIGKKMNEWNEKAENACEFLACKNDDGRSFKQIANIIERAAGLV